ncbi:MAG: YlqD family protein [Candidatus Sericytochromatia bacterium]|nr:YlqD family protein [Candidatus Sericytochromatia bacterium]
MKSISLKRQVAIKAIVTDVFKANASNEIQQQLQQLDLNMQQLEFQAKRAITDLEKQKPSAGALDNLKAQIDQERQRIAMSKSDLLQRMNMIAQLEMNSEFIQGTLDNYVSVNVGDNLYDKLSNTEIVLKDGVVVEIRGQE